MLNSSKKMCAGGKNQAALTFIGVVFLFIVLSCSMLKERNDPFPSEFHGVWEGENRAVLRFKEDGKGDLVFMKDNTEFTLEDCLVYDSKKKTITCTNENPLGTEIKIEQMPKNGEMRLGKVNYFREEDLNKKAKPSDDDLQRLVRKTILKINDAIRDEDFEDYYKTLARSYKARTSPEDQKKNFKPFIEKGFDFSAIRKMDADFSDETRVFVEIGRSTLKVKGNYDTKPKTYFDFSYVYENNEWKLTQLRNFETK